MIQPESTPPLILTLRLDSESHEFFTALRKIHFPPERNYLDAHLTLFHHLQDNQHTLEFISSIKHRSFNLEANGMKFLGCGVAYAIESAELQSIRGEIAKKLENDLINQDKQGYRPHITIQNKVSPEMAKRLLHNLQMNFQPITIVGLGLDLWQYLGGPWKHHSYHPFEISADQP